LCLIKSLLRFLKKITQHYATIWNIYVSHGRALTHIRKGGKWVHLA